MKRLLLLIPAVFMLACTQKPLAFEIKQSEPERRTEKATLWSSKTELYLEYPTLVKGQDSRFAIHLTRLGDFQAVPSGRTEVHLLYTDGGTDAFSSPAPSKAGIFGVTVTPKRGGTVKMEVRLASPTLSDAHVLEGVTVYDSEAQIPAEKPATEEVINFSKEQQWALDFATGLVGTAQLRESLEVPAEVTPRSGGQTEVTAPLAGRLAPADSFPVLGARVSEGQVLASVIPPTSVPSDRASLDLARAEAQAALDYARRDRERATRLVEAGAAPAKRLDEARTAETTLEARVHAAEERIRQFEFSRSSEGSAGSAAFAIRAPIAGTIVETMTSPGANLKGGDPLFRIVDTERVYVSAIVPEADYPKIRNLSGAEIRIPGMDQPRPAGRLVSLGKVVDPSSRTFPVVYEFANADGRIAINQTVSIRLFLAGTRQGLTVPGSALVDDGGRPVVFVQVAGESFARKAVEVGRQQGEMVEILSGVKARDRIVTKGAYLIRLSAMSSQIPAHGHVH